MGTGGGASVSVFGGGGVRSGERAGGGKLTGGAVRRGVLSSD